jgi:GTP 3',8-cyclase
LYANHGVDLRELLRNGDDDQQLAVAIADLWRARNDRGAEDRKAQVQRGPAVDLEDLLADTRLEMHTRGG